MSATIEASLRLEIAQYQAALARAKGDASKFRDQLKRTGSGLGKDLFGPLKGYLGAIGLAAVGKQMFDAVLKLDGLEKMLRVTEGSAAGAARRMGELRDVGRLPGLSMEAAIQGDIRLRAIGFSAKESKRIIMEMGNALSLVGGTQEDLNGVFLALSQISSKGKVSAEELNQIAERLPQVRKVMKEVFGTSNSEDIQKLGIEANTFISGLVDGFAKLERAQPGLREDLTEITTIFTQLSSDVAGPFIREMVPAFREMASLISANSAELKRFGGELVEMARYGMWAVSELYKGWRKLGDFWGTLTDTVTQFSDYGTNFEQMRAMNAVAEEQAAQMARVAAATQQAAAAHAELAKVQSNLPPTLLGIGTPAANSATTATATATAEDPAKRLEKAQSDQRKLAEQTESDAFKKLSLAEQIKQVEDEYYATAQQHADAGAGEIEKANRMVELQRQLVGLQEQQATEQAKAAAAAADAAKAKADELAAQSQAKKSLSEEMAILQAKASGNDALAARMERELKIREKAKSIQDQTGASEAQSRRAAEQMISLEERAARRGAGGDEEEGGKPGRINGRVRNRRMMGQPYQSLAGGSGPIANRAGRNADKADGKGQNLNTLEGINKAQLDALKTLAYGA